MCEGRRAVDLGGQLGRCVFMCIGTRERERERERCWCGSRPPWWQFMKVCKCTREGGTPRDVNNDYYLGFQNLGGQFVEGGSCKG